MHRGHANLYSDSRLSSVHPLEVHSFGDRLSSPLGSEQAIVRSTRLVPCLWGSPCTYHRSAVISGRIPSPCALVGPRTIVTSLLEADPEGRKVPPLWLDTDQPLVTVGGPRGKRKTSLSCVRTHIPAPPYFSRLFREKAEKRPQGANRPLGTPLVPATRAEVSPSRRPWCGRVEGKPL